VRWRAPSRLRCHFNITEILLQFENQGDMSQPQKEEHDGSMGERLQGMD
jgi:hypothetical protein